MGHVHKVIQAIKIKMMLNRLSRAKENAMRDFLGLPPRMTWYEECTGKISEAIKDKCCHVFCPCCIYDRNRRRKRLPCWDSHILKDFIGFLGGIVMTLLLFFILVYQMDAHPKVAFSLCAVVSLVLTTVMAFSDTARCLVLLMLPQFFSGKGRMLLLMYALFLAINHPLMNMNKNITVMSQSTTCGQEMALNGTKELVKAASAPIQSVISSVEDVIKNLQDFSNSLRDMYLALDKAVTQMAATIMKAVSWLSGMVDKCNEKVGSPYKKCKAAFAHARSKCRDKMWLLKGVCDIVSVVSHVCSIVRVGELLCKIAELIQNFLKSSVDLPAKRVINNAIQMFYFNVTIDYNFNYTFTQSKSYTEVRKDISREIHGRLDSFMGAVSVAKSFMLFGILLIVVKAVIYRRKWLYDDRYDNIYITFTLRDLDERRVEKNKPPILPLNFDEESKYVESLSTKMIMKEKKKLAFGLILFIMSFFNAAFYLFCDFGLYSILNIINKHFKTQSKVPIPPHTKLHVAGDGPMADMYKSVIGMFDPLTGADVNVDVTPCVPHPYEPDWGVYKLIGFIYLVCLFLTISEAYGLRLRHVVMACYHTRRERRRAIWLYNHIMKTRGGVLDSAREKIRKKHVGQLDTEHISLKGRLAASYPICEKLLKWFGWEMKNCLYCGREGKPDDYFNFIHCAFYDCDAVYCLDCYADLDNKCAVCFKAVDVKAAAVSEEVDSSLDEKEKMLSKAQKSAKAEKIKTIKAEKRTSHRLAGIKAQMSMPFGNTNTVRRAGTPSTQATQATPATQATKSSSGSSTDSSSNSSREDIIAGSKPLGVRHKLDKNHIVTTGKRTEIQAIQGTKSSSGSTSSSSVSSESPNRHNVHQRQDKDHATNFVRLTSTPKRVSEKEPFLFIKPRNSVASTNLHERYTNQNASISLDYEEGSSFLRYSDADSDSYTHVGFRQPNRNDSAQHDIQDWMEDGFSHVSLDDSSDEDRTIYRQSNHNDSAQYIDTTDVDDTDTDSSSSMSDCSSVSTDDLDYSYQHRKHLTLTESETDDEQFEHKKHRNREKLDLVTYDIYREPRNNVDSLDDDSDPEIVIEPQGMRMHRQ